MGKYEPSAEWFDKLAEKHAQYRLAKAAKNFSESDRLRGDLVSMGALDIDTDNMKWHPLFESAESRSARLSCLPL